MATNNDVQALIQNPKLPPHEILTRYKTIFRQVLDGDKKISKLAGRKLSQNYGQNLIDATKYCIKELGKSMVKDREEALLTILTSSLDALGRINSFVFENAIDFYSLAYNALLIFTEKMRYATCYELSVKLISALEQEGKSKQFIILLLQASIIKANAIIYEQTISVERLDMAYEILWAKGRELLLSLGSFQLTKQEHGTLNKIYQQFSKLMINCGNTLDSLASGEMSLHKQALQIRTRAMEYLSKTRPFIQTDYTAFSYTSTHNAYKIVASSQDQEFMQEIVNSINTQLKYIEDQTIDFCSDKCIRSVYEIQYRLLLKLENYSLALSLIERLILQIQSDSEYAQLLRVKYAIEMAKCVYFSQNWSLQQIEQVLGIIQSFFGYYTANGLVCIEDLAQLTQVVSQIQQNYEIWLKKLAMLHTAKAFKDGIPVPVNQLGAYIAILKYYAHIADLHAQISNKTSKADLDLYNYVIGFYSILSYSFTHSENDLAVGLSHFIKLNEKPNIFFSNCYNISLSLIHIGQREVAFKLISIIIDSLQASYVQLERTHLVVFELAVKYCLEVKNYFTHCKKSITNIIQNQLNRYSGHDLPINVLFSLIHIYQRLDHGYIEVCIENNMDIKAFIQSPQVISHYVIQLAKGCCRIKQQLVEREAHCIQKYLLIAQKTGCKALIEYYSHMIQVIFQLLIQHGNEKQQNMALLKYIEIVTCCEGAFEDEWLIGEFKQMQGCAINQKLQSLIVDLMNGSKDPKAFIWNAILNFEEIKQTEINSTSFWPQQSSVGNYIKSIEQLNACLQLVQAQIGVSIEIDPCDFEIEITKNDKELDPCWIDDMIQQILLAGSILDLLQQHQPAAIAFTLARHLLSNQSSSDQTISILHYRTAASLYHAGLIQESQEQKKLAEIYIPSYKSDVHMDVLHGDLWLGYYIAEFQFLGGNLLTCIQSLKGILDQINIEHMQYKRMHILKTKSLLLLSKAEFWSNNVKAAFELATEARKLMNEFTINTAVMQNLSLNQSIAQLSMAKFKFEDDKQKNQRQCIRKVVFPCNNWDIQNVSISLIDHMTDIYLHLGQLTDAQIFICHGLKISRALGLLSPFLYYRQKLCQVQLQSTTEPSLVHTNIQQERLIVPDPIDFLQNIYSEVFEQILASYEGIQTDSMPLSDVFQMITLRDIENLGYFIDRSALAMAILTLGDLTHSTHLDNFRRTGTEQNYYQLAKGMLLNKFQGLVYRKLKSSLYLKEGLAMRKIKGGDASLGYFIRAAAELGCCDQFLRSFLGKGQCCQNFTIQPTLLNDINRCLIQAAEVMLEKGDADQAYGILKEIAQYEGIRSGDVQRQMYSILAQNIHLDVWLRSYYCFKSIGVGYTNQFEMLSDRDYNALTSFSHFTDFLQDINHTIIGISDGNNQLKNGLTVTRFSKEPITMQTSNFCECSQSSLKLQQAIENFVKIMRDSSTTTSNDGFFIQRQAISWWKQRETLNDQLRVWLSEFQNSVLGIYSPLLQSDFLDPELERQVYQAASQIQVRPCRACGQEFPITFIKCLISALLSGDLQVDDIKQNAETVLGVQTFEKISRAARSLKRVTGGKTFERSPLVLLVSGNLQYLPWESIQVLSACQVYRNISLVFCKDSQTEVDPRSCYYILNPSKDLEHTQSVFEPFFNQQDTWEGIVQHMPTESSYAQALESYEMLVYCGHSSGEQYIKGAKIKCLKIKSTAFLMGCSSGLLRPTGQFEPQGIVVQYLLGQSPAVIANLWDVTDKDIDRYSIDLLKKVIQGGTLGDLAKRARGACKLPYLIGAAPIVYGNPLRFKDTQQQINPHGSSQQLTAHFQLFSLQSLDPPLHKQNELARRTSAKLAVAGHQ